MCIETSGRRPVCREELSALQLTKGRTSSPGEVLLPGRPAGRDGISYEEEKERMVESLWT